MQLAVTQFRKGLPLRVSMDEKVLFKATYRTA